eukprot:58525_1
MASEDSNALKKWLKKEEIYDPDLELTLASQNISDPTTDFKSYTQSEWDDLYRQCVVERAKDLKDQKSKIRLEKKMKKLEKYWRKQSGIKSTSVQKKQKKSSKGQSTTNASRASNTNAMREAAKLKNFLKKNDIFDKDLVIILCGMGVLSEDDLGKIDSNKKFDEISRELRVSTAKELKDQKTRLRHQKMMTKFEKVWRKKTGIKKKSSQTAKSKTTQSKKGPKSTRNEELESSGKELKQWMQKNKVWEKSLYDELRSNGIQNGDDLEGISQRKFDEIVRKVRVDRFSQLKDQKSRNRADKLLVKFEKTWRKVTGIKSTSIKQTAAAAAGDKEEIMPWYLSGKQKNTKNAALAGAMRSPHQKKKDNKVLNKMRESAAVEHEWIEKYSQAKYGGYIAPKEEKKYGKKKGKEEKGEEEEVASDVPNLYAIEVDFGEIVVDHCIEMLLTLHESWEGRVSILNVLFGQLLDEKCTEDEYALKCCKFLLAIGHQFTDPRSLIIQAMEECVSKLATSAPQRFIFFAPYVLTALFVTFPVRIEALRDPGVKLGKFLILKLNEYDTKHEVLRTVFEGLQSKHAAVRTECADYLDFMVRSIGVLEKDDATEEEQALLKDVDDAVKRACKDASSEARMNGYRTLTQYKAVAPNAAQQIIDKMTNAQLKKFEEANANPHYE